MLLTALSAGLERESGVMGDDFDARIRQVAAYGIGIFAYQQCNSFLVAMPSAAAAAVTKLVAMARSTTTGSSSTLDGNDDEEGGGEGEEEAEEWVLVRENAVSALGKLTRALHLLSARVSSSSSSSSSSSPPSSSSPSVPTNPTAAAAVAFSPLPPPSSFMPAATALAQGCAFPSLVELQKGLQNIWLGCLPLRLDEMEAKIAHGTLVVR